MEYHLSRFPGAGSVCLRCQEPDIPVNNQLIDDTHLGKIRLYSTKDHTS